MLRRVLKKEIGIKDLFTATLIGHTFKFPDLLEGKSNFKFDMDRNVPSLSLSVSCTIQLSACGHQSRTEEMARSGPQNGQVLMMMNSTSHLSSPSDRFWPRLRQNIDF